jgi:hypothetical protein
MLLFTRLRKHDFGRVVTDLSHYYSQWIPGLCSILANHVVLLPRPCVGGLHMADVELAQLEIDAFSRARSYNERLGQLSHTPCMSQKPKSSQKQDSPSPRTYFSQSVSMPALQVYGSPEVAAVASSVRAQRR